MFDNSRQIQVTPTDEPITLQFIFVVGRVEQSYFLIFTPTNMVQICHDEDDNESEYIAGINPRAHRRGIAKRRCKGSRVRAGFFPTRVLVSEQYEGFSIRK